MEYSKLSSKIELTSIHRGIETLIERLVNDEEKSNISYKGINAWNYIEEKFKGMRGSVYYNAIDEEFVFIDYDKKNEESKYKIYDRLYHFVCEVYDHERDKLDLDYAFRDQDMTKVNDLIQMYEKGHTIYHQEESIEAIFENIIDNNPDVAAIFYNPSNGCFDVVEQEDLLQHMIDRKISIGMILMYET